MVHSGPRLLTHNSLPRASATAALQAAVPGPQCAAGHLRRLHARPARLSCANIPCQQHSARRLHVSQRAC